METGNLSIHSENILPIIKKWLYSDTDIFVRELVSNGVDAITKLKKLKDMGDAEVPDDEVYKISVFVDKKNKQLIFEDNGIGMSQGEIKEYINQIAFSGASAFMEKYKDSETEIIGHFGLGFYSSFMVSDKVQIDSLSYAPGNPATRWECEGGIEYSMGVSDKTTRGTTITLYVGEAGEEFLEPYKLRSILTKYCGFVPVPVFVDEIKEPEEKEVIDDEKEKEEPTEPKPINETNPLWLKNANDCTDEEYKIFYNKVFTDFNEPLFWIHLNMDFPFRLKGILYFPKLKHDLEYIEGQVKLYNNQVFVADNIKEVIPEYLLLLKGVMDCPDLPLNVSRSFLQNDANVKKMSGYISRKVADKLNGLFKKERETFNGYWDDIAPFIKYGCIKERELYDKIKGSVLYKTTDGVHMTLTEFTEKYHTVAETTDAEKTPPRKTVYYVTNEQIQSQYITMFKNQGLAAVLLTTNLDTPFVNYLEMYEPEIKFTRIDADITEALKESSEEVKGEEKQYEDLEKMFKEILGKENLKLSVEPLKADSVSSVMLLSEHSRRMMEMSKMFGGGSLPNDMFKEEHTLVLNRNHTLIKSLLVIKDESERRNDVELIASHLYDLAMLGHKPLDGEQMTKFIERSNKILEIATS